MEIPKRIQRKRTKGWRKPENTVNVCRPSKWGNRYKVGTQQYHFGTFVFVKDNAHAVELFEKYIKRKCQNDNPFLHTLKTNLRGKNLMCFCPLDSPCHADVLLKIANE